MSQSPEPLNVVTTKGYDKDAKRARKRGKDMARVIAVVDVLRNRRPLAERHHDHALTGAWLGWRDCHVEPDWVLVYRVDEEAGELILGRTGTHSELF